MVLKNQPIKLQLSLLTLFYSILNAWQFYTQGQAFVLNACVLSTLPTYILNIDVKISFLESTTNT
jgi:hypothetical protein